MSPQERSGTDPTRGVLLSSRTLAGHRRDWNLANRQSLQVSQGDMRVPGHRGRFGRGLEGHTALSKVYKTTNPHLFWCPGRIRK